jgi:alkanesulfonate monooxygenase SsuD/methylene tetrahydromethanopterin reductase-like flavin-dependent oxidoreductase (luciferase family)
VLAEPYCLIGVAVLCAEDAEKARWLHGSSRLSVLRLRTGRPSTLPSPQEAAGYLYTATDRHLMASATASHVVGDPASVVAELNRLVAVTGVNELMVTTSTFGHDERLRSYEVLAEHAAAQGSTITTGAAVGPEGGGTRAAAGGGRSGGGGGRSGGGGGS